MSMAKSSVISGFYKLSPKARLEIVADFAGLTAEEVQFLQQSSSLPVEVADHMVENLIGVFPEPMGVAVNFQVNGKDYLIPMATEEPSVIAAASYAAKMVRDGGGFKTSSTSPVMIGQIQVVKVDDAENSKKAILGAKVEILKKANEQDPILNNFGGGARISTLELLTPLWEKWLLCIYMWIVEMLWAPTPLTQCAKPLLQ